MTYYYINARPGAGKTTWVVTELVPRYLKYGMNCLMVVPTTRLCDEVVKLSSKRFKTIHGENYTGDVVKTIKKVFEEQRSGEALVITEASFLMLVNRITPDNWIVIKDEASEPLQIHTIQCPDSRNLLSKWLNLEQVTPDKISKKLFRVTSLNDGCIKTSTINDGITGVPHQLRECVRNPHLEVLIDTSRLSWNIPQLVYSVFTKPSVYGGFDGAYVLTQRFLHRSSC
jgi:hypothetical protein